jgi:hypothetical protein
MKPAAKKTGKASVVAMALTWDGARWPSRALPPKARAFLAGKSGKLSIPSVRAISKLAADDQVREIRICWVPALKGGEPALCDPFSTTGKRVAFHAVKTQRFDDVLGVVYRR